MAVYELRHKQTQQVRYVDAESAEKAIRFLEELYKARPDSAFRYWSDVEQVAVRELSAEEVSEIDPSHIE